MANQKLENLLNLALSISEQERERLPDLNVGYDKATNEWELIIKYHNKIDLPENSGIKIEYLIAGYAIVTIKEPLLKPFVDLDEVEFVEKPKRLYFQDTNIFEAKQEACIFPVTEAEPYLTGKGTIIAIIDSGIDYKNDAFRLSDGKTRILDLWDQAAIQKEEEGLVAPKGYYDGVLFTRKIINEALQEKREIDTFDVTGHGTEVASIAAGKVLAGNIQGKRNYIGVAPDAELIIVKLGSSKDNSFPRTTQLMRALNFVVEKANEYRKPVSINVSFGNTYGSHTGDSLLERFINQIAEVGKNNVVIGSGNEGAGLGHTSGNFIKEGMVEFQVGYYESSLNIQMWLEFEDDFEITLEGPNDDRAIILSTKAGSSNVDGQMDQKEIGNTKVLIYIGEPMPYSTNQEIYFDFLPKEQYIDAGLWRIYIKPRNVLNGQIAFYMPSQTVRGDNTFFFLPNPDRTITIPATASRAITVGAYNQVYDAYAVFSGRGYIYEMVGNRKILDLAEAKPDILAPGVSIEAINHLNQTVYVSGTSFSTPFVTGSIALMMEYGIVRGNDPYLYGEKVKAYLRQGAEILNGYEQIPNSQIGWGALCLKKSIL